MTPWRFEGASNREPRKFPIVPLRLDYFAGAGAGCAAAGGGAAGGEPAELPAVVDAGAGVAAAAACGWAAGLIQQA
jgi:hypothetical protein